MPMVSPRASSRCEADARLPGRRRRPHVAEHGAWGSAAYCFLIVKLPVQRFETAPLTTLSWPRPDIFTMKGSVLVPTAGTFIQPESSPSLVRLSLPHGPSALPFAKVTVVEWRTGHSPPTVVP